MGGPADDRSLRLRRAGRRVLWLAAAAWPFLELFTAIWVAEQIGWGWTLLALATLSVLGAWLLRDTMRQARREARAQAAAPDSAGLVQAGRLGVRTAAGSLLLVPGFLTGLAGLVLLVPPVAERLRRRTASRLRVRATRYGVYPGWDGTIVAGEVIRDQPPGSGGPPAPPPALPPGQGR